jgi:ribosomal protein L2
MFLKRNKPRSPAKRWEVLTGNDVLKKTKYRKFLNKSTRKGFEVKKTNRKRLISAKTQYYYLRRGIPISSFNSRINFVSKVTYANFFKASIEFKKGSFYYVKAPSGYRTATYLTRRSFLEVNRGLYFTGDSIPL